MCVEGVRNPESPPVGVVNFKFIGVSEILNLQNLSKNSEDHLGFMRGSGIPIKFE